MQFWGGEPILGFHRLYNILPKFIEYYPNLNHFMTSTNFTYDKWFDEFFGFLDILKKYPNRNFQFSLQLSIDGPSFINDKNRGNGTTDLFLKTFNQFAQNIESHTSSNIKIDIHFKQTLTEYDISNLLSKESIINYFKFFDELVTIFKKYVKNKNIIIGCNVPNTAVPGYTTVQDGKNFALYCKLCYEITQENLQGHKIFQNYKNIMSFLQRRDIDYCDFKNGNIAFCGAGINKLGLLPDYKVCICHSGFVDYIEEYKKMSESSINTTERCIDTNFFRTDNLQKSVFSLEEFQEYQKMLISLNDRKSCCGYINLSLLIKMLAKYNQIEKKYNNEENLKEATAFLNNILPNCIRNNINISGNLLSPPIGLIKLLLNGAEEYINEGSRI